MNLMYFLWLLLLVLLFYDLVFCFIEIYKKNIHHGNSKNVRDFVTTNVTNILGVTFGNSNKKKSF